MKLSVRISVANICYIQHHIAVIISQLQQLAYFSSNQITIIVF